MKIICLMKSFQKMESSGFANEKIQSNFRTYALSIQKINGLDFLRIGFQEDFQT